MAAVPEARRSPAGRPPAGDDSSGIQISDTIEIRCGLDHVFDFVSDGERLPAWMAGVKRAKRTSSSGLRGLNAETGVVGAGAGAVYRIVGKALGRRVESRYELTAYEPPKQFSSRMESKFFCLEQTYTFDEADGVTTLRLSGKAIPLGRFKLLAPFLFLAMQRQVRNDHRKLKSVLERSKGVVPNGPARRRKAATAAAPEGATEG